MLLLPRTRARRLIYFRLNPLVLCQPRLELCDLCAQPGRLVIRRLDLQVFALDVEFER